MTSLLIIRKAFAFLMSARCKTVVTDVTSKISSPIEENVAGGFGGQLMSVLDWLTGLELVGEPCGIFRGHCWRTMRDSKENQILLQQIAKAFARKEQVSWTAVSTKILVRRALTDMDLQRASSKCSFRL